VFYIQNVRGFTPLEAGLLMLPFAAAQVVVAPLSSRLVAQRGAKLVCTIGMVLVSISLSGFTQLGADTPLWVLEVLFFVQGVGMANVTPPATEAIMSVLPRERAGVGSAIGNTVRQVGGALGVAVLGSVLASVYRGQITPHLTGLPDAVRATAAESLPATDGVAAAMGPAGRALIEPANQAFLSAMHAAAAGSAIVAILGALVVLRWLPGRYIAQHRQVPSQRSAPDRVAETAGSRRE
jgi:Na+/melibiose symporter-like transporter